MADHVYRKFINENYFSTSIRAEPTIVVTSGTGGWHSNTNITGSNSLSLYGGVRSRQDVGPTGTTGFCIYPLVAVDTNTIDQTIGVPDPYPHTCSINFFVCNNIPHPFANSATDTQWYEEHFSVISRLSDWYAYNYKRTYQLSSSYPNTISGFHIPEMFYGRHVATGSVLMTINSFPSSGTLYWKDDGLGRIWQVSTPETQWSVSGSVQISGNVFYNEGLIVFTNPSSFWHSELKSQGSGSITKQLQFRGVNPINSMVFMCRMGSAEVNASNNPTYYTTDETGKRWAHNSGSAEAVTYISAIGVYNEERQLVAVAKIAQPIRKREKDLVDIRLRLDI